MENLIESPILDNKGNTLKIGDFVKLVWVESLDNDDVQHDVGDKLQYIGGMDDNIGCFIHCKYNKRTDFFADRVVKL